VSLIYWIENTKTDVELIFPKHGILSPRTMDHWVLLLSGVETVKKTTDRMLSQVGLSLLITLRPKRKIFWH